jgi:hypothetical protein
LTTSVSFHGFLDRCFAVEAVDLVEIHIVEAEALQAVVDGVHDVLARKTPLVGILAHRVVHLRRNDNLLPRDAQFLQGPSRHHLACAVRVYVRGIEEIDAHLQRALEERFRRVVVEYPVAPFRRAVAHAAQADARYLEAGTAEIHIFHCGSFCLVHFLFNNWTG